MAGSAPSRQAQSSEGCVCQSRDLQSVHVHSDVKYSMFKAQTGILSPPPNPHAYCIIHITSIDDCMGKRSSAFPVLLCSQQQQSFSSLYCKNASCLDLHSNGVQAQGRNKYHKTARPQSAYIKFINVAIISAHYGLCFHREVGVVSSLCHNYDSVSCFPLITSSTEFLTS